jgi:probable rRNA maturation factor
MPTVQVRNAQRKLQVPTRELQQFAERALALCLDEQSRGGELPNLEEVAVVIISDRRIAELHRRFMKITGPTDVITFQHGELFVSAETAQRQAEQYGTATDDELRLYIVHGLLHLHGYDDTTRSGSREMEAVQRRLVAAACASTGCRRHRLV